MRTDMHQQAFPGEDISDRPEPEVAAAALLRLLDDAAAQRPLPGQRLPGAPASSRARRWPGDNAPPACLPRPAPLTRDGVRLLVATPDGLAHARFRDLPRFLAPGDLLVVNTSATLAAAVAAQRCRRTRGDRPSLQPAR